MPPPPQNPQQPGASPGTSLSKEYTREQVRFAPHVVVLQQWNRVNEAMAAGEDPMPAFLSWAADLTAIARDDAVFHRDMDAADALVDGILEERGFIDRISYVAIYKSVYVSVMSRHGLLAGSKPGAIDSLASVRSHGTP